MFHKDECHCQRLHMNKRRNRMAKKKKKTPLLCSICSCIHGYKWPTMILIDEIKARMALNLLVLSSFIFSPFITKESSSRYFVGWVTTTSVVESCELSDRSEASVEDDCVFFMLIKSLHTNHLHLIGTYFVRTPLYYS